MIFSYSMDDVAMELLHPRICVSFITGVEVHCSSIDVHERMKHFYMMYMHILTFGVIQDLIIQFFFRDQNE